jgi:protein-L-isoaspartate(D-aspartate) O-methyltransferase
VKELLEWGESNVAKYSNYIRKDGKGIAQFFLADGRGGYPANAPYDRIIVGASVKTIPEELKKQLKIGGKMVIPVGESLWYLEKKGEDDFYTEEYPGFIFVPLV